MKDFEFSPVEELIEDIRNGKLIIITDDEDRENEGDLVCAAELITPEKINTMILGIPIRLKITGETSIITNKRANTNI